MKVSFALAVGGALLAGCGQSKTDLGADAGNEWHSPTPRLHLIIPSRYGPAQDLLALGFRNPDTMKVRYQFQIRRYTGPQYVLVAEGQTSLLAPTGTEQINYSTLPTGPFIYKTDSLRVLLSNADTHQRYGDFLLTQ
ncbi:hypothetical protein [Hymenobacter coccineus]|uniref:Uncharacterized protein n=1 Tax=Hymenobacter coccineus TaxID=1908235 RepID=A0A1G1TKN9_9BACT|nr:hypothetical protein [Hymenobacter coccineus]OGX91439.1 hypothetical protein BEN49_19740 [Hymenobacter coccineus]